MSTKRESDEWHGKYEIDLSDERLDESVNQMEQDERDEQGKLEFKELEVKALRQLKKRVERLVASLQLTMEMRELRLKNYLKRLLEDCEKRERGDKEEECENCGMTDVLLTVGYCVGCTCAHCGDNGTMNAMGWCDTCEVLLQPTEQNEKTATP